nr:4Fe-4S binding protein [Ideonella sp. A 288]
MRPRAPRPAARLPDIDAARCTGCGWCVAACDLHLLSLEVRHWRKTSVLHEPGRCTGCGLCAVRCPFHVITLRAPAAGQARKAAVAAPDQPADGR